MCAVMLDNAKHTAAWHVRTCANKKCGKSFTTRSKRPDAVCPECDRIRHGYKAVKRIVYNWIVVSDPLPKDIGGLQGNEYSGEETKNMLTFNSLLGCTIKQKNGNCALYKVLDKGVLLCKGKKYTLSSRFYLEPKETQP